VIAATPLADTCPPDRLRSVTAAVVEEPSVPEPDEERELPPLVLTGDDEADETLALLRKITQQIHEAQDYVAELSDERKRVVLDLRRRHGVLFRLIADAAGSTDQTIYKIHREAIRDEEDRAAYEEAVAEQTRLGYPSLDAYREAEAEALVDGLPDVPPYVEPEPEQPEDDEQQEADDA
jgi:hypothetical protein